LYEVRFLVVIIIGIGSGHFTIYTSVKKWPSVTNEIKYPT